VPSLTGTVQECIFNTFFEILVQSKNVIDPTVLKAWVQSRDRFEVTRSWYDEPIPGLAVPDFAQKNLRLRVASSTFQEVYNANPLLYDHATHYTYDIHGNVNTLVQEHPQMELDGGYDALLGFVNHRFKRIDYTYDLISGNVKTVAYQKGNRISSTTATRTMPTTA